MGWSGRAPAPPASEAGPGGSKVKEHAMSEKLNSAIARRARRLTCARPRVLRSAESHLQRRARLGQQVELKQPRSGIVDEVFNACPPRADLWLRAGKSVQTKPPFARGENDARYPLVLAEPVVGGCKPSEVGH